MRLKFLGWLDDGDGGKYRLWNVFGMKTIEDGSTVGLESILDGIKGA